LLLPDSDGQVAVLRMRTDESLFSVGFFIIWVKRATISDACRHHAVWAGLTLVGVLLMMFPISMRPDSS